MHPVQNEAALFLPEHELLVVADLHIGIEYELRKYGVYINSRVERLAERIKQIASKVKATKLLILGDVKHVIPSSPKYQQDALIKFFHEISKDMDVYMVPGNHDGGLKKIVEDISIFPSDGWFLEDMSVGFFHGHRWPNDHVVRCKTLVAAHTHPTVTLKDSFGYKFIESCWVISKPNISEMKRRYADIKAERIVIMPAFNPLCGGVSVNVDGVLGPIGKMIDLPSSEIYLLNGTMLGKLGNLK